jgi:hypothetical protein
MIRLSALAAIILQVAGTAALATEVLLFGGAASSQAQPVHPVVYMDRAGEPHRPARWSWTLYDHRPD